MDTTSLMPSHLRIAATLRQRITAAPVPGGFLPAERDLAAEFGVSRNTLRRAIRTLAGEGLVQVADNCRPRIAAGAAPAAMTPELTHIALFTPVPFAGRLEPGSGEFVNLVGAVVTAAERAGTAIVYVNTTGKDFATREAVARHLAPFYRGAIYHAIGGAHPGVTAALEDWGRPVVVVGGGIAPAATSIHTVDLDQAAGTAQAVAHLRAGGRRRIVHLTYDEGLPWVEARVAAFRAAIGPDAVVLRVASAAQMGRDDQRARIAARIAAALPAEADAVIAGNDFLAACVAQQARGLGRRIPDDLAIIGYDDVVFAVENDLSSIASMAWEQGRRAVQILLDALAGGPAGVCHREHITPRLVVRGSSPRPA